VKRFARAGKSLNSRKEFFMNTPDRSLAKTDAFSVAELEARFEMEALPVAFGGDALMDWKCGCACYF
jgi:hypothetical protein